MLMQAITKKIPPAKALVWFGYFPVIFILVTGQLDLFFLWLTSFLNRKGWIAAIAAAALTLKPQIAIVVLPWTLLDWLTRDRKTLLKSVGVGIVIHSLPLLYSPDIYRDWINNLTSTHNYYILNSPGIFSFTYFSISLFAILPFALAVAIYGFTLGHPGSISANLFTTPFGLWYNTVLLAGEVPWQWMIPASWVAFGLAALAKAAYPFALIPAVAFLWMVLHRRQVREANEQLTSPFRITSMA
jgi:hypothetical protein